MAQEARALGLDIMVGNMTGTALAMAPAHAGRPALQGRRSRWRRSSCGTIASPGTEYRERHGVVSADSVGRRQHDDTEVDAAEVAARAHAAASDWFGQPRGLTVLFLTDMWEQFSFFGMRSLLVFYMVKQLLLAQEKASLIYGVYAAFVYFTPIVGGVICGPLARQAQLGGHRRLDHGARPLHDGVRAAVLSSRSPPSRIGNGLFLPSLPSQIGALYREDDPRRRSAYNFYYMGVNIGGFLAPLGCGTVGELYGWHWGFTVAGIGMVIGLRDLSRSAAAICRARPRCARGDQSASRSRHRAGRAGRRADGSHCSPASPGSPWSSAPHTSRSATHCRSGSSTRTARWAPSSFR